MMKWMSRKIRLYLIGAIIFCGALVFTVNFTDACKLRSIDVNSREQVEDVTRFGLNPELPLIKQPLDSMAESILAQSHIYKIEVKMSLPDKVSIATNNFTPVCMLVDSYSGELVGVNTNGRLVPLKNCELEWESPMLTSVYAGKMFDYAKDVRVSLLVEELMTLRERNKELYRLIDEIDFGNNDFLKVSLDGLPYRLKVRTESFSSDMLRFVDFISRFSPDINDVKLLDLCYDEMIIASRGKK